MEEHSQPFFYDLADLPGQTIVDLMGEGEQAEQMYELFGRDLVTKTILHSTKLSVYHERAKPGERVKPHRHGTHQLTHVLSGELVFGARRVGPGMGYFSPDKLYSWRAGDEGAEWIEIHAGEPGIFVDRPDA